MKKRILILTASFGEGHNSAARGIRDGLARVAPDQAEVELRDLLAESYGLLNELVRRAYLALVNFASPAWGTVYRWFDRDKDLDREFARLLRLKTHEPLPVARILSSSPILSPSTQRGTTALPTISLLQISKAQTCCRAAAL